ncbi:MAG: GNAT family N-acetyltransferase [Parvibaculum sp.]|nr:GNAT family N-acetyltransferase [Parvibaculum sp.]
MAPISLKKKRTMLRLAWPDEGPALSALAMLSKAHWGYDTDFMNRCRDELTITQGKIGRERVRVAEVGGKVAGFASMAVLGGKAEVGDIFVHPKFMSSGIGHLLINDLLQYALRHGISSVHVEADPNAKDFYTKQGFSQCGEAPSGSIAGRMLPLMEMNF